MSMKPATNTFIRAMQFMKSRIAPYTTGIVGMSIFYASITVVEAYLLKIVIDASVKQDMSLLKLGLGIIGVTAAAIVILIPFFQYMYVSNAQYGLADVRTAIFRHRGRLPLAYYEKHHSGSLVSRILNDSENMSKLYTERIRRLTAPFLYGISYAIPMFLLDWRISSALIAVNCISVYLNTLFSKPIKRLSGNIQSTTARMTENLINILAGLQIIKMFQIGSRIQTRYAEKNEEQTRFSLERNQLVSALDSVNTLLGFVNNLGLLVVGALLVSWQVTTFGTLIALMNLQRRLNFAFLQVGAYIPQVHDSLAGADRVFEFLDEPVEPETYAMTPSKTKAKDYIYFEEVKFTYSNARKPALTKLNLSVGQGQTVALVGPSGGGKSTILKLLLGFYPPESGSIAVAGKTLGELRLDNLRQQIAYVPQDAYLFNGTIGENIQYGNLQASPEQIIAAAKAAHAHEFIIQLPDGYETSVGERGGRLSGGQKQRIAIARAFLKNSPILLLDEATSALDSESERLVQQALRELMKHRTTLVIAHRLSTIEHADVIAVINEGRVVELGSHNDLIARGGLFCELQQSQYQAEATNGT
jgi:ATP-binding cassette subfamily B protein